MILAKGGGHQASLTKHGHGAGTEEGGSVGSGPSPPAKASTRVDKVFPSTHRPSARWVSEKR